MVLGREHGRTRSTCDPIRLSVRTLVCRPRREGIVHGSHGLRHPSPCSGTDFIDHKLAEACGAHCLLCRCVGLSGRDNMSTVNDAVRGRRLASPVRVTLASKVGDDLDGAWWPHTASVAQELPELAGALFSRLGQVIDISVNWSSLEGSADLDALNRTTPAQPDRAVGHQRLMTITGSHARANLLVVPSRTSSALAQMVLRQAAALPILPAERNTQTFWTADGIVRAARAESALCALRLREARRSHVDAADSSVGV